MEQALLIWGEFGDHPHQLFNDPRIIEQLNGYTISDFIIDIDNPTEYDGQLFRLCAGSFSVGLQIKKL